MLKMYKILLIGSTGKIGRNVLDELLSHEEFDIRLLLRRQPGNIPSAGSFFQGDINLVESLYQAIEWCDVVVNCSGLVSYKKQDHPNLYRTNVDGTKNILDACGKFNKPLLHTSSAVVYGSSREPVPHIETVVTSRNYLSGYALSKLRADQLILESSVRSVIMRPSTLISSHGSTFSKLLALYRNGFQAGLKGGASFVEPNDISRVYPRAILHLLNGGFANDIFNIGGNNVLIREVFDFFLKHEPRKTTYIPSGVLKGVSYFNDSFLLPFLNKSIVTRENYLTGSLFTYINSDKAKQELGYTITPFCEAAKNILNYVDYR